MGLQKQVTLNATLDDAFNYVLSISKLNTFSLNSESKVMNKIILGHTSTNIEVGFSKLSDEETVLTATILDKNNSNIVNDQLADNAMINFDNALSSVVECNDFTPR